MPAAAKKKRSRRPPPSTLVRRWSVVGVVLIVGYFYVHPITAYFSTRHDLSTTRAEVHRLRAEKHALTQQLAIASSTEALAHAARELGYVRRGEHLFIVKGIEAWKRAHTLGERGR
jgi:cell division protein FtsB